MPEIRVETGVAEYKINEACQVSFNPTDSAFVEQLFNAFDTLDKKQEAYRDEAGKLSDSRKVFSFAAARDAEMREIIDGIFELPVCTALFGKMNVYAMADGLPVWCNLMFALMDECDTAFAREQKATNPRIQKYIAKYRK